MLLSIINILIYCIRWNKINFGIIFLTYSNHFDLMHISLVVLKFYSSKKPDKILNGKKMHKNWSFIGYQFP